MPSLPVLPSVPVTPCTEGGIITPPPPPPFPPPTLPPIPPSTGGGNGNLIYVSTHKGLAACLQAYGTNGTDGVPQWINENGLYPDNLAGDALKIRWFNLDPWSGVNSDNGPHLTAGWAMTDAGLYRCVGLPNNATWTLKFTAADADTLLGLSGCVLAYAITPSVRLSGFIAAIALKDVGGGISKAYFCWSTNNGGIWNGDSSKWQRVSGATAIADLMVSASYHIDNTYYISTQGRFFGNEVYADFPANDFLYCMRSTSLPTFLPAAAGEAPFGAGGWVSQPYGNSTGLPYTEDSRSYRSVSGEGALGGARAVARHTNLFNPMWSPGYYNPGTDFGDAAFGAGAAGLARGFFVHMFNEDKMVILIKSNPYLFVSTNSGGTWIDRTPTLNGAAWNPMTSLFQMPSYQNNFFMTGRNASTNKSSVGWTRDFGVTFTDIDSAGLNTLLSIAAGDMDDSQIVADAFYTGNFSSTATGSGVDVSHYQGTMNWATAYSAGVRFAFMKASQGSAYTDSQFATNWSGALTAGIRRGAYHYFENATDPTAQANHFLAVMNSSYGELGPAVDCEDESASLDPANLKTFLDRVETVSGKKCVIYTRASWWNQYVGFQNWAKDYPLWVANWNVPVPHLPDGWDAWAYWQFSSRGDGPTYGAQSNFIDLDKELGA